MGGTGTCFRGTWTRCPDWLVFDGKVKAEGGSLVKRETALSDSEYDGAFSEQRPVFGSSPILRGAPLGNNRNHCISLLAACSKGQFVQAGTTSEGHKGERRVVWEEWSRTERHSLCRPCSWVRFSRRLVEFGSLMRLPARSQAKNRR